MFLTQNKSKKKSKNIHKIGMKKRRLNLKAEETASFT